MIAKDINHACVILQCKPEELFNLFILDSVQKVKYMQQGIKEMDADSEKFEAQNRNMLAHINHRQIREQYDKKFNQSSIITPEQKIILP